MSKHQKQVLSRIFHKEERERKSFIMFSLWENPFKNCGPCTLVMIHNPCAGQYRSQYLNIEILNILCDRHSPNPGFWCLMSFGHLNSDT